MALTPIHMAVGIQLSRQSKWAPTLEFGAGSPSISLEFQVREMLVSEYIRTDESLTITMSIRLIGDVSVHGMHLVDHHSAFDGNVIAELQFYSNGAVEILVKHDGQGKNQVTKYRLVWAQFDQLKVYLQANYPHLVQFLPP